MQDFRLSKESQELCDLNPGDLVVLTRQVEKAFRNWEERTVSRYFAPPGRVAIVHGQNHPGQITVYAVFDSEDGKRQIQAHRTTPIGSVRLVQSGFMEMEQTPVSGVV